MEQGAKPSDGELSAKLNAGGGIDPDKGAEGLTARASGRMHFGLNRLPL